MSVNLQPEKALIFRIVHVDNVPWILERGALFCRNSPEQDPNYIAIGNPDLIAKRSGRTVPLPPGGSFSDYVPFYFTPFSPMMLNIHTGYGGIRRRENDEIVIFVSSLPRLAELGIPFVFTNQHAYAAGTEFFADLDGLKRVDWDLLRSRNFKTSDADPNRQVRYQAEAMVHRQVPLEALLGICCNSAKNRVRLEALLHSRGLEVSVKVTPTWYF